MTGGLGGQAAPVLVGDIPLGELVAPGEGRGGHGTALGQEGAWPGGAPGAPKPHDQDPKVLLCPHSHTAGSPRCSWAPKSTCLGPKAMGPQPKSAHGFPKPHSQVPGVSPPNNMARSQRGSHVPKTTWLGPRNGHSVPKSPGHVPKVLLSPPRWCGRVPQAQGGSQSCPLLPKPLGWGCCHPPPAVTHLTGGGWSLGGSGVSGCRGSPCP